MLPNATIFAVAQVVPTYLTAASGKWSALRAASMLRGVFTILAANATAVKGYRTLDSRCRVRAITLPGRALRPRFLPCHGLPVDAGTPRAPTLGTPGSVAALKAS